jgi:hypothetical protein
MRDLLKLVSGLIIVVALIVVGAIYFESFITEESVKIVVTKVETIQDGNEKYYLIHSKDEVFENRHYRFHNKGDLDKIKNSLKIGKAYSIKVVGYNFGFQLPLSSKYRNIILVEKEIPIERKKIRRLN